MSETPGQGAKYVSARCEQRLYPPYHALHGTPHEMLWRRVTIQTPRGDAAFEQTDYGHPGRLNPWETRGVASTLLPRLTELRTLAESLGALQEV
jgi:hypothetical protein